jgi:1-acyl-sn-glycerol-3-phosphate acyltransferase
MSRLRSLLFLLFQLILTPPYAFIICSVFFLRPIPRFWVIKQWCSANVWAARVICGIRYRVIGTENIPATSHLILSKHSSTFETLALNNIFFPDLVRREARAVVAAVLRLGLRARLADHDRPQRRQPRVAADGRPGP